MQLCIVECLNYVVKLRNNNRRHFIYFLIHFMKKKSLDHSKLELNKKKITELTGAAMNQLNGGAELDTQNADLWGSRLICTTSDVGTCSKASCKNTITNPSVVIVCIPL